jgi:hypothetical protein
LKTLKTRNLLAVALVVVLIVVYYIVGTDYLSQRRENRDLVLQVADTSNLLAQTVPSGEDLESRMAAAQAAMDAARSAFPQSLNTTKIINAILKIAQETGVKAVPMVTEDWATEKVSGFSYLVFRLHVTATADLEHLSTFQDRLENGEIATLVIEHLSIDRTSSPPWGVSAAEGPPTVSAGMDLAIYSRPPDQAGG